MHVGVDLAWNTRARTGLAVVDASGVLTTSAIVRSDDEIDDWLAAFGSSLINVAVDAPLVVTNASGMRECERRIGKSFGRFDASCHASNRVKAYMDPPRAWSLAERHGWVTDPAHVASASAPACVEVYPHPAMVGLFGLGRILKYKGGDLASRQAAFIYLLGHMESLEPLGLGENARWGEIRSVVENSPRQSDLDRVEDEVDAVLCAHLAWLWHTDRSALEVYDGADGGYIIAPPPPTHANTPRTPSGVSKAAEQLPESLWRSVSFTVDAKPATFATVGETAWRAAVTAAAVAAMAGIPPFEGRFAVELDFVLPAPNLKGQGWDLDNLIKPTIDALGCVIGTRPGNWSVKQADDERIEFIRASKRTAQNGESAGASIIVSVLRDDD